MKIQVAKISAGQYKVETNKGSFDTTDMELIDDINEMINDGFERNLLNHDTFEDVEETVSELVK